MFLEQIVNQVSLVTLMFLVGIGLSERASNRYGGRIPNDVQCRRVLSKVRSSPADELL